MKAVTHQDYRAFLPRKPIVDLLKYAGLDKVSEAAKETSQAVGTDLAYFMISNTVYYNNNTIIRKMLNEEYGENQKNLKYFFCINTSGWGYKNNFVGDTFRNVQCYYQDEKKFKSLLENFSSYFLDYLYYQDKKKFKSLLENEWQLENPVTSPKYIFESKNLDYKFFLTIIDKKKSKPYQLNLTNLLFIEFLTPHKIKEANFIKSNHIDHLCKKMNFDDLPEYTDKKIAYIIERILYGIAIEAKKNAKNSERKIIKGCDIKHAYERFSRLLYY